MTQMTVAAVQKHFSNLARSRQKLSRTLTSYAAGERQATSGARKIRGGASRFIRS